MNIKAQPAPATDTDGEKAEKPSVIFGLYCLNRNLLLMRIPNKQIRMI